MFIGNADVSESKRLQKRQMRNKHDTTRSAKQAPYASTSSYSVENERENEIEQAVEMVTEKEKVGTKQASFFASLQQTSRSVQMS